MFNRRYRGGTGKLLQRLSALAMVVFAGSVYRFKHQLLALFKPENIKALCRKENPLVPASLKALLATSLRVQPEARAKPGCVVEAMILDIQRKRREEKETVVRRRLMESYTRRRLFNYVFHWGNR